MKITILHNQSLFDIAIQYTGSVVNAFAIAKENNMSISEILMPGKEIEIPLVDTIDVDVKNYYEAKAIEPATSFSENSETEQELDGISYWIINKNFIVQ